MPLSRRTFMALGSTTLALPFVRPALAVEPTTAPATGEPAPSGRVVHALFPSQEPDLARETVGVSHGNLKRLRELVDARPSLARAAWDWGFGDWETALGAASHVGNREIAEYLISKGARPTLFSATMLGQLEVVKAFVAAAPGVEHIRGPHDIPLLAHARAGGEPAAAVLTYLESLGGAAPRPERKTLDESEVTALTGEYSFGPLPDERIEVGPAPSSPTAPPRVPGGELSLTRSGQSRRQLFHLGDLVFYPVGAETVRIRFAVTDGKGKRLTIHDPDPVLTAERI